MRTTGLMLVLVSVGTAQTGSPEVLASYAPAGGFAGYRIVDVDHDGRDELLVTSTDGRVQTLGFDSDSRQFVGRSASTAQLPDPDHSLLACANVVGDSALELVVAARQGVFAYSLVEGGGYGGTPLRLLRDGVTLRVGEPVFADFVKDLNQDGRPDLILPLGQVCRLYLHSGADSAGPRYRSVQDDIPIEVAVLRTTRTDYVSDRLRNIVQIPELDTVDVNGDGRPDLRIQRDSVYEFYLQTESGRFASKPIAVDLEIFRDTTPKAKVQLGRTLVVGDTQHMQSGDVNGDGIPDYVIAHRRKVWVFVAGPEGPQFTSSKTRMVAEDVSWLMLMHLDEDDREDLLVFKVQVPTVASLVLGIVSSIDVRVTALGYRSEAGGNFARKAGWRRNLTVRIPPLLSILGEAEKLIERFFAVIQKFRWATEGNFDGKRRAGATGIAMVSEGDRQLELWHSGKSAGAEILQLVLLIILDDRLVNIPCSPN